MLITKKIQLTKDIRSFLIFIIINIALPAIILNGFFQVKIDDRLIEQMLIIFVFSVGFILFALLFGWLLGKVFRLKSNKARETAFLSSFGNTGLIGIPVCASIFGAKGAVFAAVFDAGMCIMLWSVGVLLIQEDRKIGIRNLKSALTAPMIAVFIGFILILLRVDPGYFIKDISASLAGIASPLAMIYIGMLTVTIYKEKRNVSLKLLSLPIALKIFIFPLVGILVLALLPFPNDLEQILLIEMAMPSVTTASIIFALYKADESYAVMHTLFTNLLVLGTLPIVLIIGGIFL